MSKELSKVIVNTNNDLVDGAVRAQLEMIKGVVEARIKSAESGIDSDFLKPQFYSDNLFIDIQGMISSRKTVGARGGIEGGLSGLGLSISGEYGKSSQTGANIRIAREYRTLNAPDFTKLDSLSVDDLKLLASEVGKEIEELDKAELPVIAPSEE